MQVTILIATLTILGLIGIRIFFKKRERHLDPPPSPFQPPIRELYVANMGGHSILGFSIAFRIENTPLRIIAGSNTGLHNPVDVALDAENNIWVANLGDPPNVNPSLTVYAHNANGNVAPIAIMPLLNDQVPDFAGAIATRFSEAWPGAPKRPLSTYTAQCISGGILEFSLSQSSISSVGSMRGTQTQIVHPTGIAVNRVYNAVSTGNRADDYLFVAISTVPMIAGLYTVANTTNAILRFTNPPEHHNLSGPPDGVISGPATGLSNPAHICCDMTNQLYVVNRGSFNSNNPDHYITIYAAGATGDVAPVRTITSTDARPYLWSNVYGIAVDEAGLIFVSSGNSVFIFAANANSAAEPMHEITSPLDSPWIMSSPMGLAIGSPLLPNH